MTLFFAPGPHAPPHRRRARRVRAGTDLTTRRCTASLRTKDPP